MRYIGYRMVTSILRNGRPDEGSVAKLYWSEMVRRFQETSLADRGLGGVLDEEDGTDNGKWNRGFSMSFAQTIAAGSSEIQKNIISERVLGCRVVKCGRRSRRRRSSGHRLLGRPVRPADEARRFWRSKSTRPSPSASATTLHHAASEHALRNDVLLDLARAGRDRPARTTSRNRGSISRCRSIFLVEHASQPPIASDVSWNRRTISLQYSFATEPSVPGRPLRKIDVTMR